MTRGVGGLQESLLKAIDEVDAGVAGLDMVIAEKEAKKAKRKAEQRAQLIEEARATTRATQTSPFSTK